MKLKNYLYKPFNGAFAKASAANNPSAHFSHALHYILIMIHRKAFQRYCLARHALCLFLTHRELIKGITSAEKFTVMCIRGSDKEVKCMHKRILEAIICSEEKPNFDKETFLHANFKFQGAFIIKAKSSNLWHC